MKSLWTGLFAAGISVLVGCNSKSPPGGPGATPRATDRTNASASDNTFQLVMPGGQTDLKQGESKVVRLGITRGKGFDQDVKLEFAGMPKGFKVTPASSALKPTMNEVAVTLEAAPDAALGEFKITVTGTPAQGAKTSADFAVEVHKP